MSENFQEKFEQYASQGTIHAFGRKWGISPEPLPLDKKQIRELEGLGHVLARFQQASDEIYRRSVNGSLPAWISEVLDAGKPQWLIDIQREAGRQGQYPRVIRPDLLLTEDGFSLTELDSVPGGMGITGWLSKLYAAKGFDIIGGENGLAEGFSKITETDSATVIAEESFEYRSEMEWLIEQVGGNRKLLSPEEFEKLTDKPENVYRFFEWFDWQTSAVFKNLAEKSITGSLNLTAPALPHLEDKLWLALFWTPSLRKIWQSALRGSHLKRLQQLIPFGWVVDPTPLPAQAALPRLDVASWQDVAEFSQKERRLVLKISGFHESAWGSRSVNIGHDMPTAEWQAALDKALAEFSEQPWVVQEFKDTKIIEHPVYNEQGKVEIRQGRVRLCPYYFIDNEGNTKLHGFLATLAPIDKKKIHGMDDAILLPCTPA